MTAPNVPIDHEDATALCTREGWRLYRERIAAWRRGERKQVVEPIEVIERRNAPGA